MKEKEGIRRTVISLCVSYQAAEVIMKVDDFRQWDVCPLRRGRRGGFRTARWHILDDTR
jgi:hypothetical protein